ncbi:MAG: hypothetical protein IJX88_05755 [Clostridia bacterium]|nr:hypothetical protein [Clostridia bacterium]
MAKRGYTVEVIFDPGSGTFFELTGATVQDYFNPSEYTPDEDGTVSIKLMDPLDERRDTSSGDPISLGKSGAFLVGWYTEREVVKNDAGKALDIEGRELTERYNGTFYYVDEKGKEITTLPAYEYSGLWDFETSELKYNAAEHEETDGRMSVTLYAGWLNNYTFEYYQEDATSGEWVRYASTNFSYGQGTDNDTIWIPRWENEATQSGKMNHTHAYASASGNYTFPAVEKRTFTEAYTDEACTAESKITDSFKHQGSVNTATCTAVNPIQKIYVKTVEGNRYRVATAEDLCNNGDTEGYYELLGDLNLEGYTWPVAFTTNTFKGRFEAATAVTIENVSARITRNISSDNSATEAYGGLFGYIDGGATVKNVSFKNVTVSIDSAMCKAGQTAGFGSFAGYIHEQASVTGVSVENVVLKLYVFSMSKSDWSLNAIANGNVAGILHNAKTVKIECYSEDYKTYFSYNYDPRTLVIDEDGNVTFTVGNCTTWNNKNPDLENYYEFEY